MACDCRNEINILKMKKLVEEKIFLLIFLYERLKSTKMLNKNQIPMFKHKRRICKVLMKKEIIVLTYKIFHRKFSSTRCTTSKKGI